MADAMLSAAVGRILALLEEQARYHVNLVRGAKKEVLQLSDKLNTIRTVLDDAENRRFKDKKINSWLSKLEQTSYQMEDVLDEWNYAILKLQMEEHQSDYAPPKKKVSSFIPSSSSCLCFKKAAVRHDISKKILDVKAQLDVILKEKDQFSFLMSQPTSETSPASWRVQSTSLIDLEKVHGRDRDRGVLVTKLIDNGGSQEDSGIQVVAIVGAGGLGKTTLAQLVHNDSRVEKSFDLRIWICVSDPFDLAAITKGILESIEKGSSPNTNQLEVLFKDVKETISGKKFLLVLDDVWTEDYNKWEPLVNSLRCGEKGSKILVTTRNERVVKMMGLKDNEIFHPGLLSDEDCWLLLSRMALSGRNKVEFEDIGQKIARKCNGLPLAAKTLGSLLRCKNNLEEWENVLNSEVWELKEAEVDLFPHLLLSYNELSPTLRRCFSYCAVFPKDSKIVVESLIGNWMALGYLGSGIDGMELKGRECFDLLSMRSLFQDFEKNDLDEIESCKMHDIVHDFAQFVRKSGRVEATRINNTSCRTCDPLLVSTVNEFCALYCDDSPPNLCGCLVRLRVLSFEKCCLQSIPQVMGNLIHLRWLNLEGNKLSCEDLNIIFQLYCLQTLCLKYCSLEVIPREIKNLIRLRHLDLSENYSLKELPNEIGNLIQLRHLNLSWNIFLNHLPNEIGNLIHLRCFQISRCISSSRLPEGFAQLTSLRTLTGFVGGRYSSKLRLLKNLNHLSGHLGLTIRLDGDEDLEDMVEDAREVELTKKIHIQQLDMIFLGENMNEKESLSSRMMMDVIDALRPHPNLRELQIFNYNGPRLPLWVVSPLNQVRMVGLYNCNQLTSLPSLGKLPCLEEIIMQEINVLEFVGREFLGLTTVTGGGDILNVQSSSNIAVIAFPKLKSLRFQNCNNWKEWEDITVEEEESAALSLMPCLTNLQISRCCNLRALPHRLLRKATSLMMNISHSPQLEQHYGLNRNIVTGLMADTHPKFIVIKSNFCSGYERYDIDETIPDLFRRYVAYVCCQEKSVFSPFAKIEVESAKIGRNHVQLRFCRINKYRGRRGFSDIDRWIVAGSDQPEEDTSANIW